MSTKHIIKERTYSDPSAAYEFAARAKRRGAYRVLVQPNGGRYLVRAWFRPKGEGK